MSKIVRNSTIVGGLVGASWFGYVGYNFMYNTPGPDRSSSFAGLDSRTIDSLKTGALMGAFGGGAGAVAGLLVGWALSSIF